MLVSRFLLSFTALTGLASARSAPPVQQPRDAAAQAPAASFYNSYWTDGKTKVSYKNEANGKYSVTWGAGGNFVVGKGWRPGSTTKVVNWNGEFKPDGYAYLSIYGWTTNPLIEFYIVENYHPDHEPAAPPEGEEKGNLTSDGSAYLIRTKMRVNKPSIVGTSTFRQIFSVRQDKRDNGTVSVENHFKAWAAAGLETGKMNYMIVAVEGNNSTGSAWAEAL